MNATWLRPFNEIRRTVAADGAWREIVGAPDTELPACGIHLAVFVEPFLGYVLDGSKTIESRFSANRCAPFGKVLIGDVLLLKRAGGPVVGIARVQAVWSYLLDEASWVTIHEKFALALRVQDPGFWERKRKQASYATLMLIGQVQALGPLEWKKRDRRGWVVIRSAPQPSIYDDENERR